MTPALGVWFTSREIYVSIVDLSMQERDILVQFWDIAVTADSAAGTSGTMERFRRLASLAPARADRR